MEDKQPLLNIFNADITGDGKKVLITLVSGEGDNRKYYKTCVKLDNTQKVKAEIDGFNKIVLLSVPLSLKPQERDEDLPF